MSTYVYLQCLDHNPPLRADEESGQHLYDLPQLRADVRDREALVEAWEAMEFTSDLGYFRTNTLRFLRQHPKCRLGIIDEYGHEHPLEEN